MNPKNPFLIEGYHSPEYFCDREAETAAITSAMQNDRNVTLVAPRRMGKSGVVKNVFHGMRQNGEFKCAYIDIFGTQNLAEFVRAFSSGVFSAFEGTFEKACEGAVKFLRGFRPSITVDAFGNRKYSFDVQPSMAEDSLDGIFDYLASRPFRTVVAFDEFQQIAEYPEKGLEAKLRGRMQDLVGNRFIFSGSNQHMMGDIFGSSRRPFFHSTEMMGLGPIDVEKYFDFANYHCAKSGISLDREVFRYAYERFDGITWYVQAVMNRLFEWRVSQPDRQVIDEAIERLISGSVYEFEGILRNCSDGGARLLKAIARDGLVKELTSGDFLSRHGFRAASSVRAAFDSLIAADLIYPKDGGWIVYDRLFGIWLSRL